MSDTPHSTTPQFTPPIAGQAAPHVTEPDVPHVPIPHMGTSHAPATQNQAQPQAQPQPQALPPLPPGVTEEAVSHAIAHVEQTGSTEGIAPNVLAAACQRIEAVAAQQGINLGAGDEQATGPSSYVEAAVMDKNGTFERFEQQRDHLKSAVAEQRQNAQKPYHDALNKAGGNARGNAEGNTSPDAAVNQVDSETMQALAEALKDLDPKTIALINAMGVISSTPSVLNSIVWIEVIRALRNLISHEARQHSQADKHTSAA